MAMAEIDSRMKFSGFRKKPLLVCSKAIPQTNVGKLSVPNLGIRFKDTYRTLVPHADLSPDIVTITAFHSQPPQTRDLTLSGGRTTYGWWN